MIDATFRMPIFMEKHFKAKWMIWQNSTLGAVFQIGDAWTDTYSLKKSVGIQWRMKGFSFYNFPTAIEVEYHQPLDKFEIEVMNNDDTIDKPTTIKYGDKGRGSGRAYVKILFDF